MRKLKMLSQSSITSNIPLVNEGNAIFHVARFKGNQQAAETLEAFQATREESSNPVLDDHMLD